ncbi:chemotaxis protein CheR [Pseudonocardia sp. EC080610-09]|uniref:CheR family methyltransferase n=1 Tax=unclassified Pseudonocardia TaxID=2619320 RepID=UPI000706A582|nr:MULTISPECIES: CheR family methyltransferase [unclassified Pseudonocardia]ALL74755.1 chemotaxis protein CheR [Pseudonocardia sp. EC080610-09]ALL81778.1 chemotaxis protein CheR [Pseudonocardia sp. EC080619-01]
MSDVARDGGPDPEFEHLLDFLKEMRGFDFTGYKRSSLRRRIERRMQQLAISGLDEYLDRLQVDQDEFARLFNTILINVTGFFRDHDSWMHLQHDVLPSLLATLRPGEPVRVWSAGCASGEETYGLAILLAEALGAEGFRERVKIYGTDVDEDALATARQAAYTAKDLEAVIPEWRDRYFERNGQRYVFRPDLRRSVIFGRNDLVQDAPIGRLDLLVCRNTLMYLNAQTQAQVLGRFHFALKPGGALFLGKAEMLLSHTRLFVPTDLKRRFFRKSDSPGLRVTSLEPLFSNDAASVPRVEDETLMSSPVATLAVSPDGVLGLANRRAETQLGLSGREVGRHVGELELFTRVAKLSSTLDQVQQQRGSAVLHEVEWTHNNETMHFDVQLVPLPVDGNGGTPAAIFFTDVSRYRQLAKELEQAHRQVESAYEQLQSTVEELETTNEELQSTVEELETTNEELQSTNEELETMNEELQSTNDELQSINDELRDRTAELDGTNDFLQAVLESLRSAVVVVDSELMVLAWNHRAADLWGLRSDEATGRHLLNLDIGLPTERIRPIVWDTLAERRPEDDEDGAEPVVVTEREDDRSGSDGRPDRSTVVVDAINRRGRTVRIEVAVAPLRYHERGRSGAIIVMDQIEPSD